MLPIGLAYWREMTERAAFLGGAKVPFPTRRVRDYLWDGMVCLGAIVAGLGLVGALFSALPELSRLPVILVKGAGAEKTYY
jgi:hypothetical protein